MVYYGSLSSTRQQGLVLLMTIHNHKCKWLATQTGDQLLDTDASGVAPGGFALNLDLDIGSRYPSDLWVCEDYIRLYDYCGVHFDYV